MGIKIAFVEWWPRVCGVTEVSRHWAAGAVPLGHAADLLTFTPSGKPAREWAAADISRCWAVHRLADAVEVLDAYDLVILSDIICQAPKVTGGRAKKNWKVPFFLDVMRATTTPWTTMLHDGCYHSRHDETIDTMLGLPNFTRTVITSRPVPVRARFAKHGLEKVRVVHHPYLPYDFSSFTRPPAPRRERAFIMTSRIATTKGQNTALQLLPDLPGNVHLWGASAYGMPSLAWRMLWEFGVALGYEPVLTPRVRRGTKATNPNIHKFYTGEFILRAPGGPYYCYHDGFDSQDDVDWSPWFSLSLTNDSLHGSLEVMSLDAAAHGAIVVVPKGQTTEDYKELFRLPYVGASWSWGEGTKGPVVAKRQDWDRDGILSTLKMLCSSFDDGELEAIRAAQLAELTARHDPAEALRVLLEAL